MARGNLLPFGFGSQRGDPFQLLRREMEQLFDNVGGSAGEAIGRRRQHRRAAHGHQ